MITLRLSQVLFFMAFFGAVHYGTCCADPPVDFNAEVAPILQQHCLRCHNPENSKGDLSLATAADLNDSGYVFPGDPDSSHLVDVITGTGDQPPRMPKQSDPLSDEQVAQIRRWIADGATWPDGVHLEMPAVTDLQWWSLRTLKQPELPANKLDHPVDAFLESKRREHDLTAVGLAGPRTLIRRVTYDLTGLPPTPEEIERFLVSRDRNPDQAWNDLIDRLLDSPGFGEKWGRHWLDVARYAETHGYDKDKPRENAWPYRDYVIRSLNDDKPYGRFVREQVAGDVLYPDDPDGVLGLGFLAAGPWDFIGHWEVGEEKLDGRIAKHLDRDEMVSAVFNVFQSTTVQCARCHHHKFDPIRMEDYYRLHAVFAAVDRADRVYDGLPPDQQQEKAALVERINTLKQDRERLDTQIKRRLAAQVSGIDRRIAELKQEHGAVLEPQYGYHSRIAQKQDVIKWVQVDLGRPRVISHVHLIPAFDDYADIGAGFGFPVRYRVEGSNDPKFVGGEVQVLADAVAEDQPNPQSRCVEIDAGGAAVRYLRVTATKLAERRDDFIFALGELRAIDPATGDNVALSASVTAGDSIESGVRWSRTNLTDGIFYQQVDDPEARRELHQLQRKRAAIEKEVRPPETEARLAEIQQKLKKLSAELKDFPDGKMVYAATTHFPGGGQFVPTEGEPRPIHLLHRGDLRSPGKRMYPGAPPLWAGASETFFQKQDWNEGQARAELARYLTSHNNPLVWRSIANRLWQWTFHHPLVRTPNDFGRMGGKPTHPKLLDYLAARLRDDPEQSLKSIVRLLVTSRAYRRASTHDTANAEIDAGNAYLWRFHRRRLTAEEIRDSILAVSGMLRLEPRGGPSYQDFVVKKPQHSPHYQYHLHDPDDPATHRRSIYRFVVRSQPQPMLTTLDCADPSISVARRNESTTALQALTQWNNRLVEAMSRHFAERLRAEGAEDLDGRVDLACRLAWGRLPNSTERPVLTDLLTNHGAATLARVLMNSSAFTYVD